jgi:creatinine amidohydrolase
MSGARVYELEALSSPALRRLIDGGVTTVVVPFGSVEQQGSHLPLGADAIVADVVGREVAARVDAVLAPTVRVGVAEQHMHGAGTLTLRPATLTDLAFEIGRSLAQHGFQVIALVSTHGGNTAALNAAAERLNDACKGVTACAPRGDVGPDPGDHSGEWLTSVMLAIRPDLVQTEGVGAADRDRGAAHLERFVAAIAREIQV